MDIQGTYDCIKEQIEFFESTFIYDYRVKISFPNMNHMEPMILTHFWFDYSDVLYFYSASSNSPKLVCQPMNNVSFLLEATHPDEENARVIFKKPK